MLRYSKGKPQSLAWNRPGKAAEVPGAERHIRIVRSEIHGSGSSPSKGADWQCTQRGFWEMNPWG